PGAWNKNARIFRPRFWAAPTRHGRDTEKDWKKTHVGNAPHQIAGEKTQESKIAQIVLPCPAARLVLDSSLPWEWRSSVADATNPLHRRHCRRATAGLPLRLSRPIMQDNGRRIFLTGTGQLIRNIRRSIVRWLTRRKQLA